MADALHREKSKRLPEPDKRSPGTRPGPFFTKAEPAFQNRNSTMSTAIDQVLDHRQHDRSRAVGAEDQVRGKFGVTARGPDDGDAHGWHGRRWCCAAEEKTEFTVVLSSSGDKKIQVIKVVRELTGPWPQGAKDRWTALRRLVKASPKDDAAR